jgi:hypothetical protein
VQLFQPDVPTISTSVAPAPLSALDSGGYSPHGFGPENTLDEPVWDTVKRDLHRIGANLVLVAFPFKSRDQQSAALRNWDLWGPMVSYLFQPHKPFRLRKMSHMVIAVPWSPVPGVCLLGQHVKEDCEYFHSFGKNLDVPCRHLCWYWLSAFLWGHLSHLRCFR